jgi:hypothetical protein
MGNVLHFHMKARDEAADDACLPPVNTSGQLGELIIFPGVDFARVAPSLADADPDHDATPCADCPG